MLCRHETLSDAILEERGIGLGPVTKRRGDDPQPGPDLAARIQDGDLITNSGFFDHPTAYTGYTGRLSSIELISSRENKQTGKLK